MSWTRELVSVSPSAIVRRNSKIELRPPQYGVQTRSATIGRDRTKDRSTSYAQARKTLEARAAQDGGLAAKKETAVTMIRKALAFGDSMNPQRFE
jgi:hypothetical protein